MRVRKGGSQVPTPIISPSKKKSLPRGTHKRQKENSSNTWVSRRTYAVQELSHEVDRLSRMENHHPIILPCWNSFVSLETWCRLLRGVNKPISF